MGGLENLFKGIDKIKSIVSFGVHLEFEIQSALKISLI